MPTLPPMTHILNPPIAAVHAAHPIDVLVSPALTHRDRLTCAFRPLLAIPHILLVGGPAAFAASIGLGGMHGVQLGAGTGVLGGVAMVIAIIAWFALLFGND